MRRLTFHAFTVHRLSIRLRCLLRRNLALQLGLVCLFWAIGSAIATIMRLPIPGGVVGMLLLLAALASGRVSLFSMRRGAERLIADMLLFFVPAVLSVLGHGELFGLLGLKLLAVICAGTLTVMIVTALSVDLCYRWRIVHARRAHMD